MQAAVYRVLGVRVELVVVLLDGYFKGMTRLSFFPSSVFLSLSKLRYKRSNGSTDRLRLTRVTFPIGRGGDNKQLWWKTRLVGSPFHRRAQWIRAWVGQKICWWLYFQKDQHKDASAAAASTAAVSNAAAATANTAAARATAAAWAAADAIAANNTAAADAAAAAPPPPSLPQRTRLERRTKHDPGAPGSSLPPP